MVYERKIYQQLKEWKQLSEGNSAVLIEGARRIGKSTVAQEFARKEYEDYLIIDFAQAGVEIKRNFEENIGDLTAFFRNFF